MPQNIITDFPVTLYGNVEKFSETISKGRCRIFYKGGNRNGTFITDEFAEKLLETIPYAPVKGIYEDDEGDYTDHGKKRSDGRIYGIVPANPNITWEEHEDDDEVVRTYACVDVLIYTGIYSEANEIIGKGQSMELYSPSIKGDWKIINGKKYYVFSEGCFLGLQALGDSVEPCFEGAAFFSLYEDLKKMVAQIEEYNLKLRNGGNRMHNYKISDNAKFNAIWSLLNVNFNEENNWMVEYDICEIYDEYAVVKNYSEGIFERVYYTKDDATDSVELGERVRCYFLDVTEAEKNALDALHGLNNSTYEKVDENYSAALAEVEAKTGELNTANEALEAKIGELNAANEALEAKTAEFDALTETYNTEKSANETKIGELNESIATLTTERDDAVSKLADSVITVNSLNEEIATLNSFKTDIEKKEKEAVIAKYTKGRSADVIASYTEKIDEYTCAKALDKDMAYELVSTNQSVFANNGNPQPAYVPRDTSVTGLGAILDKYKK